MIVRYVDRALFCGLTLSHLICDCCFTRRVVMVKVGHPGPPHVVGIGVPWVSLPGSTSVPSNAQAGWHRGQTADPCVVVVASCVVW